MKLNILIPLTFGLFFFNSLYAGSPANVQPIRTDIHQGRQLINNKDWNFVENKGQLADRDVSYYGHEGGVYLYCKPGTISFVFTKVENTSGNQISEATACPVETGCIPSLHGIQHQPTLTTNRTDLVLLNSNPNAQILATDQQEYYENYYTTEQLGQATGDANHGITNVHTYKTITYKDIYPHIDMVLNPRTQGMEYSFIVHPGGKVSDIQMQWKGLEDMKMAADGGIKHALGLGKMQEGKPVSYQGGNEITSRFIKKYNKTGFNVNGYDKSKDLVIDPLLSWATYFGGSGDDVGLELATDGSGNVYITGYTASISGIATSGAYQTSFSGGAYDAYLAKFNDNGMLQWATYYGGNNDDLGEEIATDRLGNVYITGYTSSDSNIATKGAYLTSLARSQDAFLVKFNGSGTLQWATYYGGNGDDYGFGVATDGSGNVFITGHTLSSSGIATSGAYQTSLIGFQDAYLAKFNSGGTLQWSTYYGGSDINAGYQVATDDSGNVYLTGYTESNSGIATSGTYQTSLAGTADAFLAKFNGNGTIQWATYFGGDSTDYGFGIATDGAGDVCIAGMTTDSYGIATKGAYQTSLAGPTDAYLARFNGNGKLQWATYYGGNKTDYGSGVAMDSSGNVYITGITISDSGIATSGAYQTSLAGTEDAYLAKFNGGGKLLLATYYGGNGIVFGNGIAADGSGNIYMTGYTTDSDFATNGAYQTSYAGVEDAFLSKFAFTNNGIERNVSQPFNLSFFPNPFNASTTLQYSLLKPSKVSIAIFDITGRQIVTIENKTQLSGQYSIDINAEKYHLTPGVYLLKFMTDEGFVSRQIVKL